MSFLFELSAVTTGLVGILAVLISYIFYKFGIYNYWQDKGIPYTRRIPFLGYAFHLFRGKGFHQTDDDMYQKHGRVFGTYEGIRPVLFVSDPELLRDIFVKDFHSFVNRRTFETGNKIVDSMITTLKDEEWKRVRSIISPTFTTGKIKGMMSDVADCAVQSTNNFIKCAETGEPVECKRLFGNFTLDVIACVAFGTKLNSHNDPDNIFVTNARKVFNKDLSLRTFLALFFPKIMKRFGIQFFQIEFFLEVVTKIIDRRRKNNEHRNDFLQLMLEKLEGNDAAKLDAKEESIGEILQNAKAGADKIEINDLDWSEATENAHNLKDHIAYSKKELSLTELIGQAIIFFMAGYDTTATTLTMVCYNLAHNQDVQKKVQAEVDEIWKKITSAKEATSSETRYIDAVIKETLRIFPPGVRLERVASEDYTLGNTGFVIPKGMIVATPLYSLQRDPEFFSDPETFIPERFLPENISSITPFTYLPFGSGPRNCVAMRLALMEVKVNLIHLLKEVEFDLCPETKSPPDFYNGNGLLQPKSVHLKVSKRNTQDLK